MLMRMIYDDSLAQAAYLFGCQATGEAIIIDPERDIDQYIEFAAREGLTIVAATETHMHADFLSGVREFCEQTEAKAYLSDEGDTDWDYLWVKGMDQRGKPYKHQLVKDGDVIRIGNIELKVIHTPGHTSEHICFEVTDRGGAATEPMGIATGDFIFVGDVGRPDLLESAAGQMGIMEPSARSLSRSLRAFHGKPEYLQVWPGHGAGSACGKALGAVPQSTMGYELRFNDALKLATDEDAFVESILSGQPEPPYYFARMKHDNRHGPKVLNGLPEPKELGVREIPDGAVVIDTRAWEAYREGHLEGSLSIVCDKLFSTVAGAFVEPEQEIVLVIGSESLEDTIRMLVRIGLDRIVGYVEPEVLRDHDGLTQVQEIDVHELDADEERVVLDVRNASEFGEGRLPGAVNVSYLQLSKRMHEVPDGKPVYVHCKSGFRSARAVSYLKKHGIHAVNVTGGYMAWEDAGFETVRQEG